MAIIGNKEISLLKAVHGVPRGIVDEDIDLYGTRGRFQNHGRGRLVGLRGSLQNAQEKEYSDPGPAVHVAVIIAARLRGVAEVGQAVRGVYGIPTPAQWLKSGLLSKCAPEADQRGPVSMNPVFLPERRHFSGLRLTRHIEPTADVPIFWSRNPQAPDFGTISAAIL